MNQIDSKLQLNLNFLTTLEPKNYFHFKKIKGEEKKTSFVDSILAKSSALYPEIQTAFKSGLNS